jgi:succinate-semialdehyde dehydrogenase / glutarate-semialdehyde dehydrogenase
MQFDTSDETSLTRPAPGVFMDGRWHSRARSAFNVVDPARGSAMGAVETATEGDAVLAAQAAGRAAPLWAERSSRDRAAVLDAVADQLASLKASLARTIVRENGKPFDEAASEVDWAEAFFRTYADEARRLTASVLPRDGARQPLVEPVAYGPVLAITPWNDPLGMIARQIAPALAAGCSIVWKPADLTPFTAIAFADAVTSAGLPPGVLNVFLTDSPHAPVTRIIDERLVRKIVFTGSTSVGFALAGRAASKGIPTNLELGGNAAFIVMESADIEAAVRGIALRKFVQSGQGCTCVNRVYVHRQVAAELLDGLVGIASTIEVGDGLDPKVTMGPLITPAAVVRVDRLAERALEQGARQVWTGRRPADPALSGGSFSEPRILLDVTDAHDIIRTEIFGPVLPVLVYDELDRAIEAANAVDHGLAGYVYGEDAKALAAARRLEVGLVGVNEASPQAPYYPVGGIKSSGWGVAGGAEGLREYLHFRSMSIRP